MGIHKQVPRGLSIERFEQQWADSAEDPRERRKLKICLVLCGVALFVVVPAAIGAAGSRKRELHGSARWANAGEVRKAGLLSGEPGIVVGKLNGKFLTLRGQLSVLLSAPTRSGKGVGIVIPNLLSWPDSVVTVDIKGENYARTAGFRAAHGQKVYLWAPFADDNRSYRWNPLSAIRVDERNTVGDILAIGQVLYPTDLKGSGTEAFFNDQARNLFLGLTLYLVETPTLPRTLGEILRQASGKGRSLKEHLQTIITERAKSDRPLSDTCVDALNRFLGTSENTLTSILATLNSPLTIFAEPLVDAATGRDDFSLEDLRRRRMSVYVVVPPNRLADSAVLLNLFFSQAINLNTRTLPEHDPSLKHQCLFVLDEFTAMGRVGIVSKAVGYLAGYNLRLLTVIQSVSQLDDVYGKDQARTFATNHAMQILYAPREQRDANEYSEMLGTLTEKSASEGRSVSTGGKGSSSRSTNMSPQRRALLLPQEFKEIGQDRQVVIFENCKPIFASKIAYYQDPVLCGRVMPPPEASMIDLGLHRAHVEQRIRPATDSDTFTLEQLAGEFGRMPRLAPDASSAEVSDWVAKFFASPAIEIVPDESAAKGAPREVAGRATVQAASLPRSVVEEPDETRRELLVNSLRVELTPASASGQAGDEVEAPDALFVIEEATDDSTASDSADEVAGTGSSTETAREFL
ncbi:MAG: type IV secretory system conjugative DNA transfer family protein [Rhodocyclales bacterium]|nr:type IV secretory system conjugative DNA transfer family protein [Rhodocyclales bacterium]